MYSWKSDEFGNVVRAKARLVARGFGRRNDINFFDTFSPCPSVMSIRLLAALACELDLNLCHFDAEQASVQSDLDEVVYTLAPWLRCVVWQVGEVAPQSVRFEASFANVALSFGQKDEGFRV